MRLNPQKGYKSAFETDIGTLGLNTRVVIRKAVSSSGAPSWFGGGNRICESRSGKCASVADTTSILSGYCHRGGVFSHCLFNKRTLRPTMQALDIAWHNSCTRLGTGVGQEWRGFQNDTVRILMRQVGVAIHPSHRMLGKGGWYMVEIELWRWPPRHRH